MFLSNKYTATYMRLMDSRKKLNRKRLKQDGTLHSHHIIPKCFGGSNHVSNRVLLTVREHYVAHRLLTKMFTGKRKRSMFMAMIRFLGKNREATNSRKYDAAYREISKNMVGEKNHFYGKTHTPETRNQLSISIKRYHATNKNAFYGKHHTPECKEIMAKLKRHPLKVTFLDGTVKEFIDTKQLSVYIGMSHPLAAKLQNPKFTHLMNKYNIERIEKI